MKKRIVLLSDGTGNSAAKLFRTNVWRLYQALDLTNEAEQIAYYDDGVGSSKFRPWALLTGAVGIGLKRNVIDLYCFLCRNYEEGDDIYCFGFSRGAFTIRILIGLINSQGLVKEDSEERLRAEAVKAFQRYRNVWKHWGRKLRKAQRSLGMTSHAAPPKTRDGAPNITFVGLWDTVAAYGLPVDELTKLLSFVLPLSVPDRNPCPIMQRACHALAVDDERRTFHPVLWNEKQLHAGLEKALKEEREKGQLDETGERLLGLLKTLQEHKAGRKEREEAEESLQGLRNQRAARKKPDDAELGEHRMNLAKQGITQVWFAGAHSDVGGGYAEDGLDYISLDWIMGEAHKEGLVFDRPSWDRINAATNVNGMLHDPRQGLGAFYRYLPRDIATLCCDTKDPHNQVVIKRPKIHESVLRRIEHSDESYAPIVLPAEYATLDAGGKVPYVRETPDRAQKRFQAQQGLSGRVRERQFLYYCSAAIVVCVFLAPFFPSLYAASTPEGWVVREWVVKILGAVLPEFLGFWIEYWAARLPELFVLLGVFSLLHLRSSRLRTRIRDTMRAIWKPKPTAAQPVAGTTMPADA